MNPIETTNTILSLLTILGQVLLLAGLAQIILQRTTGRLIGPVITNQLRLVCLYIVATVATLGSLFYSDVAGYTPCVLCWYQRIVMYPQAVIYLIALARNELLIKPYGLTLSVIGSGIALYHYLLQFQVVSFEICSAVGYSVSCSERFEATYGYITIPLMALTAFLMIIVLWLLPSRSTKAKLAKS